MLWSIKDNKIRTYVGYTTNLKRRLNQHNSGKGAKNTKGRFWVIIFRKKFKTKILAMRAEYYLKKNTNLRKKIKNSFIISKCI